MSVARAVQRRKVQVKDGDAMSSKHHVEIQPAWALFSIFQTWITHEEVERQAVNTTKQEPERSDACSSNGAERGKCEWKMVLRAIKEVALKSHCCIGIDQHWLVNHISSCWWWGEECRTLNGVMIWCVVVEMVVFEKSTCRLVHWDLRKNVQIYPRKIFGCELVSIASWLNDESYISRKRKKRRFGFCIDEVGVMWNDRVRSDWKYNQV